MINAEQRRLVHHFILLELALKSLQVDYKKTEQFKMKNVFLPLMDSLLKDLQKEYYKLKRQLSQQRIQVMGLHRVSEYFSDLQISTAGEDEVLNYANHGLKTQVESLLSNHINEKMKL